MPDADGGLLQGSVPRPDGPARLFQRSDDLLGTLAFGDLETRHRPAATAFAWHIGDAVLLAPLFHAAAHRIVPAPAPFDAALALDPAELGLEGEQQRYRGRVGRLMLGRGFQEAHEILFFFMIRQPPRSTLFPFTTRSAPAASMR